MDNGWKMEDGKWSYRHVRRALVWTHSFRGGRRRAVSQVSTRPVGTGMHTHRAVYICRLTNLTGLRYLGEIQEEALLS